MNKISLGLIVCLVFSSTATVSHAAPDPAVMEARKHFEEGTKAFNLGEFERAVKEYKASYNAKPDPVFLYNIAQAYRLANDLSQALFFYRSYLRNQPNTPNRKEIEDRIHQLEEQIAQQRAISTAPPTTPVAPGTLPPPTPTEPPPAAIPHAAAPAPAPTPAPTPAPSAPAATPEPSTSPTTAGATLSTSAPAPRRDKPVYKKGWFWGVIAGVVVVAGVGVGLGVGLTRSPSAPSTDLGNAKAFLNGGAQ